MTLVDSTGWLDHFAGVSGSGEFSRAINDAEGLLVPTVCLFEVYKWMRREKGKRDAMRAIASMKRGIIVEMNDVIALQAADASREHRLPLADSVIYATARAYRATVLTKDAHFKGLPGVRFVSG